MADLHLPLKGEYFHQIRNRTKDSEYRLVTPYWSKRLECRTYDRIVLTLGYPKKTDQSRRLILPWRGFTKQQIQHPHFGPDLVEVFAIRVCGVPMRCET
jgi:hypothetical protein